MDDTTNINIDESLLKKAEASSIALAQERQERLNDKLIDYLNVGRVSHEIAIQVKSTKTHGQHLAKLLPETQKLDETLRSNCKWLYEALHVPGSDGADILDVLEVETLTELKTANPTVIRRKYKIAKGEWDYANPKRKQASKALSEPKQSPAPPMHRQLLERWQTINGKSCEANPRPMTI